MTPEQIAAVVHLVAFLVAFVSIAIALYHFWGMVTHVQHPTSANLLAGLSILFGGLFDSDGKRHRQSFGIWFLVAFAAVVVGLASRFYLEGGVGV